MFKLLGFTYSVVCYLIGVSALVYWILATSDLIPLISLEKEITLSFLPALGINILLILMFGIQHSVMARKSFKAWVTKYISPSIERSTFVLITGFALTILVYFWQPMSGTLWSNESGTVGFYLLYGLFFLGWTILFTSSFIINHFDLFGLKQTFIPLVGKTYTDSKFKIVAFYRFVRHPLYFGGIVGVWAIPTMTTTHFVFAMFITTYFVVGTLFEEKDLLAQFGSKYKAYQLKTPMLIPLTKRRTKLQVTPAVD